MANAANRDALQSVGGGDVFAPPAELLVIAEESPKHPHHAEHAARVRIDKPEMQVLIASLREHGWRKSKTIPVYKDGTKWIVSDGRRSLTCVRIVNAERAKSKDPRGPIRPRVVLDDDPSLTTAQANEMRENDPPMVRARRYIELRQTMGATKAAAAIGETLANANALALILGTPNVELHAAVNAATIPIDVAKRAVKAGSPTVAKVIAGSKDAAGKPQAAKVRVAASEIPKRARSINARNIKAVADVLTDSEGYVKVVAALYWSCGEGDPPEWLQKAIDSAKEAAT